MADEIEEYLDAFDNVHRLALRLYQVADQIANVADTIKQSPQMALAVIPNDWPTGEKLRVLVTELASAKAQLPLLWYRVPVRLRQSIPNKRPELVDQMNLIIEE